jgi:hypothetical protein
MKRLICLLLALTLTLCFFGCAKEEEKPEAPVKFYYPRAETVYGVDDGVIAWEWRESAGHEEDYFYLVEQYLKGPQDQAFTWKFSTKVRLKKLEVIGTTAYVVLNDFASLLTGVDLMIACACLTATVAEIMDVKRVTIQAENKLLDGNATISMIRNQILLWDECTG